ENLLQWARSQTGTINFTPSDLNLKNVASECIEEVIELAEHKNILLINTVSDAYMVQADEHMLKLVFRNLLTNAIKYTNSEGSVTIAALQTEGFTEISVIDTGTGIAKEHLDKLFRIDTNYTTLGTANEKGSSLGLILCKEFIDKHNGKIWVESDINKGSTFKFTIPLALP
ncbi:MAG TPA: HAMP domain-containing sensor histidine kinase, partial [Bacteroidia bacterium]